jgi:beta-N-acetylhexosaminidase
MQELAERSITLVRNERGLVPLARGGALLHVVVSATHGVPGTALNEELRRRSPALRTLAGDPGTDARTREKAVALARAAGAVVVSIYAPLAAELPEDLARLVREVAAAGARVVVVSHASPYLLRQFADAPAYLCAYGASELSQRAVARALFGEIPLRGRLPVSLPGLHPRGHGIELDPRQTARGTPG